MLQKLKEKFPSIPEEVILSWLLPFAESENSLPDQNNKWDIRITGESLSFWNDAEWKKDKIDITKIPYSHIHNESINSLLKAYIENENNVYFEHLGESGRKRFFICFKYILENGVFPVPPILTITDKSEYEVLDGSHRFSSYKFAIKIYKELQLLSLVEYRKTIERLGMKSVVLAEDIQEVWICKPKWENSPNAVLKKYLYNLGIDLDTL